MPGKIVSFDAVLNSVKQKQKIKYDLPKLEKLKIRNKQKTF